MDVHIKRRSTVDGLPALEVSLGPPGGAMPPGLYSFEVLRGGLLSLARHVVVMEDPLAAVELLQLRENVPSLEVQEALLADVAYVVEATATLLGGVQGATARAFEYVGGVLGCFGGMSGLCLSMYVGFKHIARGHQSCCARCLISCNSFQLQVIAACSARPRSNACHHVAPHSDAEVLHVSGLASLLCTSAVVNGWLALLRVVLPATQLACGRESDMESMHAVSTWLESLSDVMEDDACCSHWADDLAYPGVPDVNGKHRVQEEKAPLVWEPAVSEPVVGMGVSLMVLMGLAAMATTEAFVAL